MKPQYMSVALGECVPEGCFLPLIQLGIFESVINFIKANYVLNLGHNFIVIVVANLPGMPYSLKEGLAPLALLNVDVYHRVL